MNWRYYLRVLLQPSCWRQVHPYSGAWDRELRRCLACFRFQKEDRYTAMLGDMRIWICNHPYASFHRYFPPCNDMPRVRPRRATMMFAYDRLIHDLLTADSGEVAELERMWGGKNG